MNRTESVYLCKLDYVKLFMAIMVVALHTHPLWSWDKNSLAFNFFDELAEIAVPFFFMASAYLLFSSCANLDSTGQRNAVLTYLKRIGSLYCLWTLIYLPISAYGYWSAGASLPGGVVSFVRNFFLVGHNFASWQLWYLLSTLWGMLGIYILHRFVKRKSIYAALAVTVFCVAWGITALVEATATEGWHALLSSIISATIASGRILLGFCYLIAGMLYASRKQFLPWYWSLPAFVILFGVAVLLQNELVSGVMHLSFFEMIMSLPNGQCKTLARSARKASTCIYYTHMLFAFLLYCMNDFAFDYGWKFFAITVLFSCGTSALILLLEKKAPRTVRFLFG